MTTSATGDATPGDPGTGSRITVAAIQPRLEIGEVDRNLARIEDLPLVCNYPRPSSGTAFTD